MGTEVKDEPKEAKEAIETEQTEETEEPKMVEETKASEATSSKSKKMEEFDEYFSSTILPESADMPPDSVKISGMDWNQHFGRNITVVELLESFAKTGYQASHLAEAVQIINNMREWDLPISPRIAGHTVTLQTAFHSSRGEQFGPSDQIFLGFTSNLVSSGLRETLRWLVQHKLVSVLVTTAGGVEEDLIKCMRPTYMGTFAADDASLREQHLNRVGNLIVPNDNYVAFDDWLRPILQSMYDDQEKRMQDYASLCHTIYEQRRNGLAFTDGWNMTPEQQRAADPGRLHWTPSTIIARLGQAINDESSILYWAYKNSIPVFCPGLTDGSFGDMLASFQFRGRNQKPFPNIVRTGNPIPRCNNGLVVDVADDIDRINSIARSANTSGRKLGAIILGSGIVKHHVMNACLNGDGANAAVYVNTAGEFDGSDAGARPSEAVSWGKLKADAESVKVNGDATILFPIIVAGTWAKHEEVEPGLVEG